MEQRLLFLSNLIASLLVLVGCNLAGAVQETPIPTPDIPQVEVLAPANNQQVFEGTIFDIDIVARDDTAGVARIELLVDETFVNEAMPVDETSVPIFRAKMNWLAQGPGFHAIEVVAYREDGTRSDAAVLNIEVIPREAADSSNDVEPSPTPDV